MSEPEIRQSDPSMGIRGYERIERTPIPVIDHVVDGVSRGARQRDILESLRPSVDWPKHKLSYRLRKWGVSKTNLKPNQRAFIYRHCEIAKEEGREMPGFEHLSGERVRRSQIERIMKEAKKFPQSELAESGDSCGIRIVDIVESDENDSEQQSRSSDDMDPDAEGECDESMLWLEGSDSSTMVGPASDSTGTGNLTLGLSEPINLTSPPDRIPSDQDTIESGGQNISYHRRPARKAAMDGWSRDANSNEIDDARDSENPQSSLADTEPTDSQETVDVDHADSGLKFTDPPEVWSQATTIELDKWIDAARSMSLEVLELILAERDASGDDIHTCFERVAAKWKPCIDYFRFIDWHLPYLPPLHILLSFFEDSESLPREFQPSLFKPLELDLPTPSEMEAESQQMRKIYRENFSDILKITLTHTKDEVWNAALRSMTVHLITIEERFGPNSYFMIRVLFRISSILERAELQEINDKDNISLLLILIKKIFRLKLEDSQVGDLPHALIHLTRSLVRIGNFSGAIQVYEKYTEYCNRIGRENKDLHEHKIAMLTGFKLMKLNQKTEAMGYLRRAFKWFHKTSPLVDKTISQGHCAAAFDFLAMGRCFREIGTPKEAVVCIQKSIEHSRCPGYEMSARTFEGVHELAMCYYKMGNNRLALKYFRNDLEYRAENRILHTAGSSLRAVARILETASLSQRVQPTNYIQRYLAACEMAGRVNNEFYLDFKYRYAPIPFIDEFAWAWSYFDR